MAKPSMRCAVAAEPVEVTPGVPVKVLAAVSCVKTLLWVAALTKSAGVYALATAAVASSP